MNSKSRLLIVIALLLIVLGAGAAGIIYGLGLFKPPADQADNTATPPAPVVAVRPHLPSGMKIAGVKKHPTKVAAKPKKPSAKKQLVAKASSKVIKPVSGAPGTAATANGATPVATTVAFNPSGPDPFKVPRPAGEPMPSVIPMQNQIPPVPNIILTTWHPQAPHPNGEHQLEPVQQGDGIPRRMSGVLFGDGVFAILETDGNSQEVQPGDSVQGGKVISIEADHLTIKTDDDKLINVPLSSTPTGGAPTGGFPGGGAGFPGGSPFPGGFPGAPGAGAGFPGRFQNPQSSD